jgi:hypothetical protein
MRDRLFRSETWARFRVSQKVAASDGSSARALQSMSMPRRFLVRIAPFWLLGLIVGSLLPGNAKTRMAPWARYSHLNRGRISLKHRLAHFASFGSTTLLLLLITRKPGQGWAVLLATVGLGFCIEYAQHIVYGTRIEWWDIRDDCYGNVAAYILAQSKAVRAALVRDP